MCIIKNIEKKSLFPPFRMLDLFHIYPYQLNLIYTTCCALCLCRVVFPSENDITKYVFVTSSNVDYNQK